MAADSPGFDPEQFLQDNLALIRRVVGRVCRHAGLRDADADDFASTVHLALIDDDYAMLRAWQRRASFATYLTVAVQRLLCDQRNRTRGRWEPSAEARRGGRAAILLETLVLRDVRPLEQVVPLVHEIDPSLSRSDLEAMLARFPTRVRRPLPVPIDDVDPETLPGPQAADAGVRARELVRLSAEVSDIVRRTLASCSVEDRTVLRLHFGSSIRVADIARMLRVPQRPLYRRVEALLHQLRRALGAGGIDAQSAESLIGSAMQDLDFGLGDGKPEGRSPSHSMDAEAQGEA